MIFQFLHAPIPSPVPIRHPIDQGLLARTGRHPLATLPRLHLANVHGVDLLQRPPLRLADEEEHNQHGGEIAPGKDISVLELDVPDDERGEERDEEIPGPVGRGDQCHAAGAVVGREQLADDAPDDGAPCGGVEGDEEAGEHDHGRAGGGGGDGVGIVERKGADGGEDQEIDCHADTADDQSPATAEALHDVETKESHAEVDAAEDHGCYEAVADAGSVEDGGSVVEEEICT